jgi:aerobic C4-dicarboxylate transport protein
VIVGIDRFMSEGRALTNFTGNAVATILIGTWTKQIDAEQVRQVLSGARPFDESLLDGVGHDGQPAVQDGAEPVSTETLGHAAVEEMAAKQQRARARAERG